MKIPFFLARSTRTFSPFASNCVTLRLLLRGVHFNRSLFNRSLYLFACCATFMFTSASSLHAQSQATTIGLYPIYGDLAELADLNEELTVAVVGLLENSGVEVLPPNEIVDAFAAAPHTPLCKEKACIALLMTLPEARTLDATILLETEMENGRVASVSYKVLRKNKSSFEEVITIPEGSSFREMAVQILEDIAKKTPFELMTDGPQASSGATANHVPGADLSPLETTTTEYPIVGPAILGAAGVALTSLAIVSLAGNKCKDKDPNSGICVNNNQTSNSAAVFGYGAFGLSAITGAVMWFVLGAEEVPVTAGPLPNEVPADIPAETIDEQAWGISYKGQF